MARTLDDLYTRANELLAKSAELGGRIDAARDTINKAASPKKAQAHPNPFRRPDGSAKTQAEIDEDKDRAAAGAGFVPKGQPAAPVEQATYAKGEPGQPAQSKERAKASDLVRKALAAIEAASELEDSEENEEVRMKVASAALGFLTKAAQIDPAIFDQPVRTIYKAAPSPAKMSYGGDPSRAKMPEVAGRVTQSDLSDNPKFANADAIAYAAANAAQVPGSVMNADASWMVSPMAAQRAQVSQSSRTGSKIFSPDADGGAVQKIAEMNRAWSYDAPELSPLTWKAFEDKGNPGRQDETMTRVVVKPLDAGRR